MLIIRILQSGREGERARVRDHIEDLCILKSNIWMDKKIKYFHQKYRPKYK